MSNQTISEAVKDLATAMAHDFYDRYAGKASLSQTRQAFIETVIRARAIDAAARVEPTNKGLEVLAEEFGKVSEETRDLEDTKSSTSLGAATDKDLGNETPTAMGVVGEETGLLPCPFCGAEAWFGEAGDGGIFIECLNPLCASSSQLKYPMGKDSAREELIEQWNTRVASQSARSKTPAAPLRKQNLWLVQRSRRRSKTMKRIQDAPEYVRKAHDLMMAGCSTREMAERMKVSIKTAASYRNKVNRVVGFDRPWANQGSGACALKSTNVHTEKTKNLFYD